MVVGITLSSDVLASAVSAYTYGKNKNLDIKNGLIMMASVLIFTVVGSYISSLVPSTTMGNFSVFMTFLLGIKFIVKPVMTTKESMQGISAKKRAVQSAGCGVLIGFICGFIGAGGGMKSVQYPSCSQAYRMKLLQARKGYICLPGLCWLYVEFNKKIIMTDRRYRKITYSGGLLFFLLS